MDCVDFDKLGGAAPAQALAAANDNVRWVQPPRRTARARRAKLELLH